MVPGLLSGSDGNGEIWVHLLLEYFPVSGSDGVAGPVNDVVIARPLGRKVVKDRAKWPRWHWCASCRLLHYPEPAPG
jgi:hypothetical protein